MKYALYHKGSIISEWDIPELWTPKYGQLLIVNYNGKMTPFRAMGMPKYGIIDLLLDSDML